MSFRILVDARMQELLRTIAPHVVLQLGQGLAALAESLSFPPGPVGLASGRVTAEGYAALYEIDREAEVIRVREIEILHTDAARAGATAAASA